MTGNYCEFIPASIIAENPELISDIERLSYGLVKEMGWHYYADIIWVMKNLRDNRISPGATILDAGAGNGLLQFLLCYHGYKTVSVDYSPRHFGGVAKRVFNIQFEKTDEKFSSNYIDHIRKVNKFLLKAKGGFNKLIRRDIHPFLVFRLFLSSKKIKQKNGAIKIYQADMCDMSRIEDNIIYAIVSVSAIEHLDYADVDRAILEFKRVAKPNSPIILTTSGSTDTDWFHTPSKGWCFSQETIRKFSNSSGNIYQKQELEIALDEYRKNEFLKKHLSSSYYVSDQNGMPNGNWDPKYFPVGIIIKK